MLVYQYMRPRAAAVRALTRWATRARHCCWRVWVARHARRRVALARSVAAPTYGEDGALGLSAMETPAPAVALLSVAENVATAVTPALLPTRLDAVAEAVAQVLRLDVYCRSSEVHTT